MKKILFFAIFVLSFIVSRQAMAASIFVMPDKDQVSENESFAVTVFVSSTDEAINNAEGILSFPSKLLSVSSIDSNSSIFNLWVEQPKFDNVSGTVSFNGGLPNPGFIGLGGKVIKIYFTAKNSGTAALSWSSATIRANDGYGTDDTEARNGTMIKIWKFTGIKTGTENLPQNAPSEPTITSAIIKNSSDWYSAKSIDISWKVPIDATAVNYVLDRKADTIPQTSYPASTNSKTISNLTDGTWYAHVRVKNSIGWSKTAHFRMNIDTTEPESLSVSSAVSQNNLIRVGFSSNDQTSGIDKYEFYVDNHLSTTVDTKTMFDADCSATSTSRQSASAIMAAAETKGCSEQSILLPYTTSGIHELRVVAYDMAGNTIEKTASISVPIINTPTITSYPTSIGTGKQIMIAGTAPFASTTVLITVQEDNLQKKVYQVISRADSTFSFMTDAITAHDAVTIFAETKLTDTLTSSPSQTISIQIKKPYYLVLGSQVIDIVSVAIPLAALIFIFIIGLIMARMHLRKLIKKVRYDLTDVENDIHSSFKDLQNDLAKHVKWLKAASKTRELTDEETYILKDMTDKIAAMDKLVTKDIKNLKERDLR